VIVVWIVLGVIVLVAIAGVISYNRFVTQRNLIKDAWANIDTELRRRYDLIPNLVATVQGYAAHEREVFESVTEARTRAIGATAVGDQATAENEITRGLRQLMAVAEAYPDLKANQNMLALQEELTSTENKIAFARQAFNDAAASYNIRREVFPANTVAGMFGFKEAALLETPEAERVAPKVSFQ